MSRKRSFPWVPRGRLDPIRTAGEALAVLALGAPYGHDTVAVLLDDGRRGDSIIVVNGTAEPDALFIVIDACIGVAQRVNADAATENLTGLILASSRPGGGTVGDDAHRWIEASDHCGSGGLELVEWFVIGRWGPQCPRDMFGEPPRWAP